MEEPMYYPIEKIADLGPWFAKLIVALQPIYLTLGITPDEMAQLENENKFIQYLVSRANAYDKANSLFILSRNIAWTGDPEHPSLELVALQPQVPVILDEEVPASIRPNLRSRIKSLVLRLRQHPKMTEPLALALGISTAPKPKLNPADFVPTLTGTIVLGLVKLDCPIKGFAGYEVWQDTSGRNEYAKLDNSFGRTYIDEVPLSEGVQAEQRHYKVRMMDTNNQPIGHFSQPISLTLTRLI